MTACWMSSSNRQASCTSQRSQKSELMERARQSTYTLQHPSHADAESRHVDRLGMAQEAYTWTQRGHQQFLDKL